jgi:hypothetical protein
MIEKYLWITGSAIFLWLGTIHLLYTFFTGKFNARNKEVITAMKNTSPVLTRDTTMWKAWIGFNASHSSGAIFFGLINILLATRYFPVIQDSLLLHLLNIVTVIFYFWLGKKYWFKVPFTGILIAACCFIAATLITFLR